jgi:hypothetical protein
MIMNQELLKKIMLYDELTGIFIWKERSQSTHMLMVKKESLHSIAHSTARFNSRCSGKIAGSNTKGYREVRIKNKNYRLHALAWLYTYGHMPDQIDHISGVRSDNSIKNLRDAAQSINTKNAARRVDNTSGFTGVYFFRRLNKWASKIVSEGKQIHVGCFGTPEEASKARIDKIRDLDLGFHENHGREQHEEYVKNGHEFTQCLVTPLGQIKITKLLSKENLS